ncbi:hypothetical protein D3C80_1633420 [compost metagenome]
MLASGVELQDGELHGGAGVIHHEFQQEAVELGLRQGIGPLLFYRVLRGRHHKERRQAPALLAHGDLLLGHGLQQGGLHLGRGPVYLVRQHQVVEQWAGLEHEAGILGVKHLAAGEIGREQVRGELDTGEAPFDGAGQRLDGPGLGKAGGPLDQHMSFT